MTTVYRRKKYEGPVRRSSLPKRRIVCEYCRKDHEPSAEASRNLYTALLMEAGGRWATVDEIYFATDLDYYGPERLQRLLDGMVALRELDIETFDDGETGYKLTEFGERWATIGVL